MEDKTPIFNDCLLQTIRRQRYDIVIKSLCNCFIKGLKKKNWEQNEASAELTVNQEI